MNTLSSLPPPSFGPAGLHGTPPAAPNAPAREAEAATLHVGPAAAPGSIDEIAQAFVAVLCEKNSG